MRNKKFRMLECLSPQEILAKVKREFEREKETQKIEETLLYLNNSFNNNIQFQEIFIDICKAKKDNIKSKELKTMYNLFSENKANSLIFHKILDNEIENAKYEKEFNETSTSKIGKETYGLMSIIEEEEPETQKNIKTKTLLQNETARESHSSLKENKNKLTKDNNERSSIHSKQFERDQNEEEIKFLIKRVYCRLMEKILVKIAFYTMNNKFLDFIATNILDLTKNLEVMIRRLENIKDLKFLHQMIEKIYKENFIIENKIYEFLVDGGFILSIDEFYRVNGIDVVHKDVYERSFFESENESKRRENMTLKEKIQQMKNKKEKENVVKKDHIDKMNKEINTNYLKCVTQIKNVIKEEDELQKKRKDFKIEDEKLTSTKEESKSFKRNRMSMSKTQPILKQLPMEMLEKQPKLFEKVSDTINLGKEEILRDSNFSQESAPKLKENLTKKSAASPKTFLNYLSRTSTFSPEFSTLIKSSVVSPTKIQRNSIILSEKFLEFNNLSKKQRKESNVSSQSSESLTTEHPIMPRRKKSSLIYETFPINRLLKLYEQKNADRYSIENFLGSNIKLPNDIRESLKEGLMKLEHIYDPNSVRKSKDSSVYSSKDEKETCEKEVNDSFNGNQFEIYPEHQYITNQIQNISDRANHENPCLNLNSKDLDSMKEQVIELDGEMHLENSDRKVISKKEKTKKQSSKEKKINPESFVKLEKDREEEVKSLERITSQNFSIFTIQGVKNLVINEDEAPFKNEKLKRIPYIKIKQKQNENHLLSTSVNFTKKISEKTACQSTKISSQSEHQTNEFENLEKTIEEVINSIPKISIQALSANKIYHKGNSLNKTLVCFKNEVENEIKRREDRFQTLHPNFMTEISDKNSLEVREKEFRRTVKLKTTECKHRGINSEPVSPSFSPNNKKFSQSPFRVYDTKQKMKFLP